MDKFYSLGLLLSRASVALSKALNTSLAANGIDLPHSQFIVLRCLYFKDALSQLEIAHLLSKDAAAIKRTVDNLEEKGLVVRKQIRALKNAIYITKKGEKLMPQVLKISDSIIDDALCSIAAKNQEQLRTMLDEIYLNLEKRKL